MEYEPSLSQTNVSKILCCDCGLPIEPNQVNKCIGCIRSKEDITDNIARQSQLHMCKLCQRFLNPPNCWTAASLESKELLSICLKRLNGLKKVRLVDAKFLWTEPHSKRVKVFLKVQKEVAGVALLQSVVVEFVVHTLLCDECQRIEAKDYWRACVQVRQKSRHKRSLFYLEQVMLRRGMYLTTTFIKQKHDGIDFFYSNKQEAWKLVEFIQSLLPSQHKDSKELVSHDTHSNKYDYKYTFSVEIAPVCKDDVICLSKSLAASLGSASQLMICYRVSTVIHLVDPLTARTFEVFSSAYWRNPFRAIAQSGELMEYTVIDVHYPHPNYGYQSFDDALDSSDKFVAAEVLVSPTSELGRIDGKQIYCSTHLGRLLSAGDTVMGLDVSSCNVNNENLERIGRDKLPEVILVRKFYDRSVRRRRRLWKLKRFQTAQVEPEPTECGYDEFLEDLEEDPVLRQNVNIYRDRTKPVDSQPPEEDEVPMISLQEMIEDMSIEDEKVGEV
uniref:60S ribosomal export protein NMD3 n=1 Tax=Trichuris muris TaxID=70415 RepID=A0A5S6QCC5_TRIMR